MICILPTRMNPGGDSRKRSSDDDDDDGMIFDYEKTVKWQFLDDTGLVPGTSVDVQLYWILDMSDGTCIRRHTFITILIDDEWPTLEQINDVRNDIILNDRDFLDEHVSLVVQHRDPSSGEVTTYLNPEDALRNARPIMTYM